MAGNLGSGRCGIPEHVEERARRLLGAQWPKAKIARELRISRWTVDRIYRGRHRTKRQSLPKRCEGCGAKIVSSACAICPSGTPLREIPLRRAA